MANPAIDLYLKDLLKESSQEFVSSTDGAAGYKFSQLKQVSDGSVAVSIAAVLGFSSDQFKGSLVIACSMEFLKKTHPNGAMGMPVEELDCRDWVGEIANQLLGRVKNKMASVGVSFSMSTPTVVAGQSIEIARPKSGETVSCEFAGPLEPLQIHFLYTADPALVFSAVPTQSAAKEGAAMLF